MFGSGIPNPKITDETGKRIAVALETKAGIVPGEDNSNFGSGIPNPELTDETGKRIALALETIERNSIVFKVDLGLDTDSDPIVTNFTIESELAFDEILEALTEDDTVFNTVMIGDGTGAGAGHYHVSADMTTGSDSDGSYIHVVAMAIGIGFLWREDSFTVADVYSLS